MAPRKKAGSKGTTTRKKAVKKATKKTPARQSTKKKTTRKKAVKKVSKKTAQKRTSKKDASSSGRPQKTIDETVIEKIEYYASHGYSIEKIAKSIGWDVATFRRYKNSNVKPYADYNDRFCEAIKRGREIQRERLYPIAIDNLEKLVTGYEYDEKHQEEKTKRIILDASVDGRDVELPAMEITTHKKQVRKYVGPNPMAVVFTVVNTSDGLFKSINKVVIKGDNNRRGILANLRKMIDNPYKGENDGSTKD